MRDADLYTRILGIEAPWRVSILEVEMVKGEMIVQVERKAEAKPCCRTAGKGSPGYDSRRRRWRHLDTWQYKTILEANSGFTAMFEALVIDWLKKASTLAV
uniref:Transposase n=1 Tax=Candidatus Kentrum sp. TC TaxID=2126339 RepID=A0A450YBQ4_9GAMM|nr:MAG: transposase [Candidatus Kentron sp. TC]